nr:protein shortage in chiasmata 1 [Quercus suber]
MVCVNLQQEAEVLYEEKEVESQGTCGTETLEIGLPNKDNRYASRYEVIQFETPEPNVFLEDACSFEKYEIQNLSEVPDNENNQEMLRQALTMQCPYEVQELIYSVENVASEYYMEQNIYVLEDDGSVQDQMCFGRSIFPSLEVDETSLGTLTCLSLKEELLLHLENTERQRWLHKGDLVIDSEELLGSRGCDVSQFLSDHFLSQQCLESELASVDMFPEMDFISMVETLQIEGNSSVSPVIFEEFQFLDMDSSQFFVVFFKTQTTDEPETCDCMFRGDMNFKNFNELIVSHELALVDNIFKSLPVPLFSDHEKIRSLSSIVEEILADLKPRPLSASDGIYLDWHLLDEDKCNSRIYSSYQSMLEEVDSHSFDFDLEAFDNGKLVFDFVLSDNALNGPNTEENKESWKFLSDGIFVPNGDIVGGTSNKLLDDQYPEPRNGEHLAEKSAERTLLFKSMSQFNDLDFFLNPRKANSGHVDSTINTVDTNAMIPDVPSSHSKAARLSTGVQLQSWEIVLQALTMQCPYEVQELIYSVENVASEYYMEQNIYVLEDDGSVQDQMCFGRSIFPSLEVDETSLGTLTCLSLKEELLLHLENTERQRWLHKGDLVIDSEELLGSRGCDVSQFLSDHFLSQQCLEYELASVDMFPEMDFISMVETLQVEGNSSVSPVIFEEFQFLDMDSSQFFVVFFKTQTTDEPETCDCMFRGDMNFKNFNELIVSHELALVDNIFKSLPVPLFSDHEKIRSLSSIVEEILADLKPRPLSASDGIYLDWHLLDEDKCNSRIYSSYQSMLEEVDSHSFDFDLEAFDNGKLVFDFVFSDDALNGPNTEENKESWKFLSDGIFVPNGDIVGGTSNKLLDDQYPEPRNGEHLAEKSAERTLLFKSMSQFNDLNFFLNPRKANSRHVDSTINTVDTNAMIPDVPSSHSKAACLSTGVQLQSWEIVLYQVKLSDTIMLIIDNFEKSYLAVLQNERELIKTDLPLLAADNHKLLSLPKQKLMDCIKKINAQRTTSHGDENIMELVTLCAIKQMAWFMCFYGILPVHLYVDKLCQSLECLKSRLGILQSLIEDAHKKIDTEICSLHPSLTVIQEILHSNTTKSNLKVLIVAEKIFWWSLKSLLMSLGLSFSEFQNYYPHAKEPDLCKTDFKFTRTDTLLVPDCLLASHEHISASFPFNKFNIILEYGGSYGISRISSFSPNLVGLPPIHFLKVELDKSSTCEALCEGVDMPCYSETAMQEDGNVKKLEKLLNFLPIENTLDMGSSGAADEAEACCMPLPLPAMPFAVKSENISQSMVSSPETVIIVNTQNFDKQMIVSRRSTYQKILAMEKEGAQVVERDSDLPVDVIMSSAICLAWYDCRNIGKKATALDEASSSMPMCVENIATNVLTLLSFAFSGCILVFEGDVNFLSTVMESSDGFYAAASSLGIDLQIFCSYSSELTDDIILSCISYVIKLTRGLYPKMPESETLAESFLTKFPSINPLTAHAILSSGGILVEFLEGSHERRIHAIEKYLVSDESVTLFSALCKYGERDDSKSIMTDCSSSVSSGPDSERCRFNMDSGRKRRKYSGSPHKIDIDMDDLPCFEPLNQITDDNLDPSTVSKPLNQWMSKDYELFDEFRTPSLTSNGLFGQKQGLDMDGFYAAASSLGIDLQIFCSYSSELTDDIILSCISYVIKLTRGLYPKMPESETLAESFLTKFPSINPLTAHAILSSGGILVEFLEGSHERRIHAIEKYLVSDESVTLFSALCKYGERDDSKSIMTDCSSSVSSGPDSERCRFNMDSGRKRRKYSGSPHKIDIDMDDLPCFEPLNQITDDNLDPSTVSKPLNQWMSKDYELFDEFRTPSLTSNGLFGQKQGLDMGMMIKPSSVTKPYDSQFSKSLPISNEIKKPYFSLSDKKFGQNQESDLAMNNLDWLSAKKPENLQDLIGEVIDLTDSPVLGKDLSSFDNSPNFSFWVPEMDGDSSRKSKIARRLSFDEGRHPTCSMAVEMNSNSDIWNFKKDQRQTVPGVNDYPDTDFNHIFPVKHCGMPDEGLTQRSAENSKELSFQEKEMSSYAGTPLSNALRSAHPQQNSPWSIEFLNRIREKSRMRHQSLPYDAVAPCLEYSGNVSKVSKRRSPSILEFFKYQGSSTPKKAPEQNRQKRSIKPSSSSKNEKISSSVLPTSTPADKRSRQTLSFAMNGSGGQTKLDYIDKISAVMCEPVVISIDMTESF